MHRENTQGIKKFRCVHVQTYHYCACIFRPFYIELPTTIDKWVYHKIKLVQGHKKLIIKCFWFPAWPFFAPCMVGQSLDWDNQNVIILFRFISCMLCKCSYFSQDAVTFNIKYCSVFVLCFQAAMWGWVNSINQKQKKKPVHLVNVG